MDRREFLKTVAGGACAMALAQWRAGYSLAAQARKFHVPRDWGTVELLGAGN